MPEIAGGVPFIFPTEIQGRMQVITDIRIIGPTELDWEIEWIQPASWEDANFFVDED